MADRGGERVDERLDREEFAEVTADIASARNLPASARKLDAHDAAQRAEIERLREAVLYLTECSMATVEYMEALSSPTKSQLERHRNIAKIGLRVLRGFSVGRDVNAPRARRALEHEGGDDGTE